MRNGLLRGVAYGLPISAALWVLIGCAALALTGCAGRQHLDTPEPVIKTLEVKVAVPVACPALAKLGPEPTYDDTDAALKSAGDIFESTRLLLKGRIQRTERLAAFGAARIACTF